MSSPPPPLNIHTPTTLSPSQTLTNTDAITLIRDAWIYKQLKSRQEEFTNYNDVTVTACTWNVNAKKLGEEDKDIDT